MGTNNLTDPRFSNSNIYQPMSRPQNSQQRSSSPVRSPVRPSSLSPRQKISKNELLNFLPCKANTFDDFHNSIKTNIGMLFIYRSEDLDFLIHIIEILLNSDPDVMMILEHQFVTYSIEDFTSEAQSVKINYFYFFAYFRF
jgi:hypothetical protein